MEAQPDAAGPDACVIFTWCVAHAFQMRLQISMLLVIMTNGGIGM